MSERKHIQPVEDFTDPFLVSLGVIFFFGFWVIGAVFGLLSVLLTAAGLDLIIQWGARRRRSDHMGRR